MNRQPQQQPTDFRRNLSTGIGLAQCFALNLAAWLRIPGTCGARYFSGQALIGWVILLVVAAVMHSPPLLEFWALTGGCFLLHKLARRSRTGTGPRPHSQFVGVSFLHVLGGNRLAYRFWEPVLTLVVGYALVRNGDNYGRVVMAFAVCLWIAAQYTEAAEQARVTAIDDARAEQAWLAEVTRRGGSSSG